MVACRIIDNFFLKYFLYQNIGGNILSILNIGVGDVPPSIYILIKALDH